MSELLQFGTHPETVRHPEADQLSAFAEQALPEYLRQETLLHLAVCPDCRAIVAMTTAAMPEEMLVPVAAAMPEKKPRSAGSWFAGWNFAWPIVAAMAALVLVILYIQQPKPGAGNIAGAVHPPTLPSGQPPGVTVQPPAKESRPAAPGPMAVEKMVAPTGDRKAAAIASENGPVTPKSIQDLPVQGRSVQPLTPLAEAQGASGATAGISAGTSRDGSVAGNFAAAQPRPALGLAKRDAAGGNAVSANSVGAAIVAAPAPAAPRAAFATPGPVANAGAMARHQAASGGLAAELTTPEADKAPPMTTVSVAAAQQVELSTMSATLDAATVTIPETPKRPLPSGLAVLSMMERGAQVVAIDSEHSVFASKDGGKHWKAVAVPWLSRAVKVDLVAPAAGTGDFAGGIVSGNGFHALKAPSGNKGSSQVSAGTGGGSVTGIVTDASGAVIPGATVTITNKTVLTPSGEISGTATTSIATTDPSGRYVVADLVPGTYSVEAQAAGFNKQAVGGIALAPSGKTSANLVLQVGASTQTVTVTADALLLSATPPASALPRVTDKTKKAISSPRPVNRLDVFSVSTDTGEHWISADGVNWQRR